MPPIEPEERERPGFFSDNLYALRAGDLRRRHAKCRGWDFRRALDPRASREPPQFDQGTRCTPLAC